MRLLKLTGLLMFLSMLAVGCSSDDDDKVPDGGEAAELYVTVRDASDNYLLEGVNVEFVQNNKTLCNDRTDDTGMALCDNKWDGLVAGSVTININVEGYKAFTKTGKVQAGDNEWEVRLTPEENKEEAMALTSEDVEDFYGKLVINVGSAAHYVRVSEGDKYDAETCDEYINDGWPLTGLTQRVTYTNLQPQTKYTFTVASFNHDGKRLETKTINFTTKELYNRSSTSVSVTDFMTLSNGVSVTLASRASVYMACYEKAKIPTAEKQIIKDAMSASELQEDMTMGYVSGLQPGKEYRLFIIPVGTETFYVSPNYISCHNVPGTVSYIDIATKNATEIAAAVPEKVNSGKNSFMYRFVKKNGCNSFKAVTFNKYDQYENLPDIAIAILCSQKGSLDIFKYSDSSGYDWYSWDYTWNNLDLTSWYGIASLGFTDTAGENNSGIISRYKFKYGSYGVTTRSTETLAPVPSSDMEYGSITDDMLKKVKVLR